MSSPTKNRVLKTLRRLPPNPDPAKAAPLKVPPASPSGQCAAPTPPPSPFDNPRYLMRNLPSPPTPPRTSSTPPVSPTKSKWGLKKVVKPPPSLPSRPSSRAAPQEAVPESPPPSPTVTQVENAMNVVATALGGIVAHCPALYAFAAESPLAKVPFLNRPAKLVFILAGVGVAQTLLPIIALPADILARIVGASFLIFLGIRCLQLGFSAARLPRALLATFLISTAIDLIPAKVIDFNKHFGGLRALIVPIGLLLVLPNGDTVAVTLANAAEPYLTLGMSHAHPSKHLGGDWHTKAAVAALALAVLFWIGWLGERGSYLTVWMGLAFQSVVILASPKPNTPPATPEALPPLGEVQNILAIWTWRLLLSAIESIEIPGVLSVRDCLTYYVPSYYTWTTAVFVAMLVVEKTQTMTHADTWYAHSLINLAARVI